MYLNLAENESLANIAKDLLEVELDKSFQNFPWSLRPLPEKAKDYARKDASYLLRIWNIIKEFYGRDEISLVYSKEICMKQYKFPRVKLTLNEDFSSILEMVTRTDKNIVEEIRSKFILFSKICDWRLRIAKNEDKKPNTILSLAHVKILLVKNPKNTVELFTCLSFTCKWPKRKQNDLINIICIGNDYEYDDMDVSTLICDVELNPLSKFEFKTIEGDNCEMDCDDDCTVEYVVCEPEDESSEDSSPGSDYIPPPGVTACTPRQCSQENPSQNLSIESICSEINEMNIENNSSISNVCNNLINMSLGAKTVKISKLEFNRARRLRHKINRNIRNEERSLLGLSKIKKNKGKKRKLRGQNFRQQKRT
jgi:hypothetical protein